MSLVLCIQDHGEYSSRPGGVGTIPRCLSLQSLLPPAVMYLTSLVALPSKLAALNSVYRPGIVLEEV